MVRIILAVALASTITLTSCSSDQRPDGQPGSNVTNKPDPLPQSNTPGADDAAHDALAMLEKTSLREGSIYYARFETAQQPVQQGGFASRLEPNRSSERTVPAFPGAPNPQETYPSGIIAMKIEMVPSGSFQLLTAKIVDYSIFRTDGAWGQVLSPQYGSPLLQWHFLNVSNPAANSPINDINDGVDQTVYAVSNGRSVGQYLLRYLNLEYPSLHDGNLTYLVKATLAMLWGLRPDQITVSKPDQIPPGSPFGG